MKLVVFLLLVFTAVAQSPITIIPQPGDTVYKDITQPNDPPYLWYHAATRTYEIIPPYTQDKVFQLLLEREQSCWYTVYWLNRSTSVGSQGLQASRAR